MGACPELVARSNKVYQPRNPRATKLYQLVNNNCDTFLRVYPEQFENKYGYLRPEIGHALENYLTCGILSHGFARVKCQNCNHEFLLAFSCKGRYFCPSCHQRRVQEFGLFLTEQILEKVPHRQIVFSLPKITRKAFLYNRELLPKLAHCGWETILEVFQAALDSEDLTPGMVVDIQTYGGLLNWHPHLHCLCTDGCFDAAGQFHALPAISAETMNKIFAAKVLKMLIQEDALSEEMAKKILSWKHSGFNTHANRRIEADDTDAIKALAEYIVRSPFNQSKITISDDGSKTIYHGKINPSLGKNFQVFDSLEFLAALTSHIPLRNKKMVVYYGWYSQAARGKRRRDGKLTSPFPLCHQGENDNRTIHYRWSQLIKNVYADPLICPACGGKMKIIAFIKDHGIINKILDHLGIQDKLPQHAHAPPTKIHIKDISYEPFFDDLPITEQIELFKSMNQ
ncbi:MAG: transposase [Spirochaetales bacterium]|nr:transposase [Spirochaetales bacterium]